MVRARDRVPGPHGRAQPGHRVDPRPHQGRPVRQVARERARLVDQPQPLLGHAHPGVGERRPGVPARRRLRLVRRARGGLRPPAAERRGRAGPAPAVHRRPHASQPGRPDGPLHDAPHPRRPRRVVRLRVDAVRAGALPVREPRVVRAPLPGRLHRRVHRPDPRLVLHAARAGHGDLRPAAFRNVMCHGIVLGDDGRKASKSLRNFPDPVAMWDKYGSDAVRWSLMSSTILRGGNLVVTRGGHPRRRAPGAAAAVEHVLLLHAVRGRRGRRAGVHRAARRRRACRGPRADGPLPAGPHAATSRDDDGASSTRTTSRPRARPCASTSTC